MRLSGSVFGLRDTYGKRRKQSPVLLWNLSRLRLVSALFIPSFLMGRLL